MPIFINFEFSKQWIEKTDPYIYNMAFNLSFNQFFFYFESSIYELKKCNAGKKGLKTKHEFFIQLKWNSRRPFNVLLG